MKYGSKRDEAVELLAEAKRSLRAGNLVVAFEAVCLAMEALGQ